MEKSVFIYCDIAYRVCPFYPFTTDREGRLLDPCCRSNSHYPQILHQLWLQYDVTTAP